MNLCHDGLLQGNGVKRQSHGYFNRNGSGFLTASLECLPNGVVDVPQTHDSITRRQWNATQDGLDGRTRIFTKDQAFGICPKPLRHAATSLVQFGFQSVGQHAHRIGFNSRGKTVLACHGPAEPSPIRTMIEESRFWSQRPVVQSGPPSKLQRDRGSVPPTP